MQTRGSLTENATRLNKSSEQLCVFFARGQCRNGSNCRFSHKLPGINSSSKCGLESLSSSSTQNGTRRALTRDPDMRLCNTVEELVHLAHDHLDTISPRGMAAFWSLLVKHLHKQDGKSRSQLNGQLNAILLNTIERIGLFSCRNLATTALGLAKVMKEVESCGLTVPAGSVYQFLHVLTVGINMEKKRYILDTVAKSSLLILSEFDARCLSNLIYSFGLAGYTPKFEGGLTILDVLANESISKLQYFNSQDLSNMLWSFATMESSNSVLFKAAGDHIVALDNLSSFKPQELANIAWAYATADQSHPQLFNIIAKHIVALYDLWNFLPQALSNIVWSYASAGESHPQLFNIISKHIVALDNLWNYLPQALSNIVWAYATAGETHPLLFQKLADVAIARRREFDSQSIANLLWAYATVGQMELHLFASFAPAAKLFLSKCNCQNIAIIAWAYAVVNVNDSSLFDTDFINTCQTKKDDFGQANLSQLHQWQLWQDELKSGINLPPALREKCFQAFVTRVPRPSRFQNDVISELLSIGLNPKEEVLTPNGYRIDALVEVNGKRVCIEVDGPHHFVSRQPTGNTILKRRQVNDLDKNRLISVPYWEWNELGTDHGKKQEYLCCKLGLFAKQRKRRSQDLLEGATYKLTNKKVAWLTGSVKSVWSPAA